MAYSVGSNSLGMFVVRICLWSMLVCLARLCLLRVVQFLFLLCVVICCVLHCSIVCVLALINDCWLSCYLFLFHLAPAGIRLGCLCLDLQIG